MERELSLPAGCVTAKAPLPAACWHGTLDWVDGCRAGSGQSCRPTSRTTLAHRPNRSPCRRPLGRWARRPPPWHRELRGTATIAMPLHGSTAITATYFRAAVLVPPADKAVLATRALPVGRTGSPPYRAELRQA